MYYTYIVHNDAHIVVDITGAGGCTMLLSHGE
jgi:hypothetical protein